MKSLLSVLHFDRKDTDIYFILISAPLLLTLYWYYGSAQKFLQYFPSWSNLPDGELYAYIAQFLSFFILVFLIPLLYIRFKMKKPLKEFGFGLGDKRYGLIFTIVVLIVLVAPLIYLAAGMPDIQAEYPLAKILHQRHDLIIWYEIGYIIFYYIAWEFFFRGFLLFGLKDKFGAMNAILIQTISSCLIHLGKPDGEILGSIVVGIIFGAIALRTRSFWYVFIIHAGIGVLTDLFVIFR
ncbi:MAG: CPBP family intramembrane metalloprotease [Calditrichaceae bacterium]|nr:CPBP family intramembrane metalloprotease [Calditrichaceae bacterium]MBN2709142.1 CPBP family intramembrane metalloprotease [Calditrichaceae bacterium]RQV96098.1 MAG: CPBP family intramembrane metalloprotease [Calditrichota bacterium]